MIFKYFSFVEQQQQPVIGLSNEKTVESYSFSPSGNLVGENKNNVGSLPRLLYNEPNLADVALPKDYRTPFDDDLDNEFEADQTLNKEIKAKPFNPFDWLTMFIFIF